MAVMTSMASYIVLTFFNNFIIPTKELVWIFQLFSDFTYPKHVFNSLLIIFYGLNRCSDTESRVLLQYGIEDRDLWFSMTCAVINMIVFNCIVICLLFVKPYLTMNYISHLMSKFISRSATLPVQHYEMNGLGESETLVNQRQIGLSDDSEQISVALDDREAVNRTRNNRTRVMIAWIDLTFTVNSDNQPKVLLNKLNGMIESQTITALMGPSGAGKTTLLKCLNGQNVWGLSCQTKFYWNSLMKIKTCFVSQNVFDHLVSGLTVEQTLIYASKLKNSKIKEKTNHRLIVNQLMDELLISDIRKTNVCDCSGGELKRIIIASELMAIEKPNMLCIDEPTSGLDSNAAQVVCKT